MNDKYNDIILKWNKKNLNKMNILNLCSLSLQNIIEEIWQDQKEGD